MNKDLFVYFLFLLVPLCVLPFAVHSFMAAEIQHGRDTGRAYLAAEAQNLATDMVTSRSDRPRAPRSSTTTGGQRQGIRFPAMVAASAKPPSHPGLQENRCV